ncbi:MAG: MiaB/RimO family radical SAM methylthiotransferase, partial [Bacteroidia bacterium]
MSKSVAFYTLGCKLNFSETSAISRQFKDAGYSVANFKDGADVYVINTCSVTDHADRKCKKIVREAKKFNPESKVAIIGCYAQLKPAEILEIPGVDGVFGASEKFNIPTHMEELGKKPTLYNSHIKEVKEYKSAFSIGERTRTFLKVQDGCNYFCSFCTIPLARGRSRSDTIENVVKTANDIAEQGVKEIVLTGVNIGDFGYPNNEKFYDLAKALDKVEGIERFRISSIEPNLLKDEIIEFVAESEKFVPHFHVPLQSGSDAILKAMRRRYERKLYKSRVEKIKALVPDCCIGVDVIVGFPGETDEEFMKTYEFLRDL